MLTRFETAAERFVFLGLVATVLVGVVVAVGSLATRVGRASPGFVVWSNLVVPAIGEIASSPEASQVPERTVVVAADGVPLAGAAALDALVRTVPIGTRVRYEFRRG